LPEGKGGREDKKEGKGLSPAFRKEERDRGERGIQAFPGGGKEWGERREKEGGTGPGRRRKKTDSASSNKASGGEEEKASNQPLRPGEKERKKREKKGEKGFSPSMKP